MAAANEEEITTEQTEKLLQFQDLTGVEDMEDCRRVMQRHDWNLESAVQNTLNEADGSSSLFDVPPPESRPVPRTPPLDIRPLNQRVFSFSGGVRGRQMGWLQWGYLLVSFPFRFVYTSIMEAIRFIFSLFRPDSRRMVTDPAGDVMSFINCYNRTFGAQHPVFYQGTYSQALNDAKKELRFLLVYLHGDQHQDTAHFCRDTLSHPTLCQFINSNMLFWACSTSKPEGYRVSLALRENTYPFLAMIVLKQNRMSLVARLEGPVNPQQLMERLSQVMEENQGWLETARAERAERNHAQILRQEQDVAYQQSLKADQEKERKKREEREQVERAEAMLRDRVEQKLKEAQDIERQKELKLESLPQEAESSDPDCVRILLKFPNGVRVERKFLSTDSLELLYDYVFCNENCSTKFQIVTNFPRRALPCQPTSEVPRPPSLQEAGLGRSEMLFVQELTEDSDDDI